MSIRKFKDNLLTQSRRAAEGIKVKVKKDHACLFTKELKIYDCFSPRLCDSALNKGYSYGRKIKNNCQRRGAESQRESKSKSPTLGLNSQEYLLICFSPCLCDSALHQGFYYHAEKRKHTEIKVMLLGECQGKRIC